MKKAQITFFVIVGILILFALGLLVYFRSAVTEFAEETPVDIQPILSHVTHCLDMTATDALDFLGKQGGYLYIKSQGGLTMDPTCPAQCIDFRGHKVYLDITPASEGCSYPRLHYPYNDPCCEGDINWIAQVGINNLPPLEHGPHSIKATLESYINNNTKKCLDFSLFKDFVIDAGDVSSSVLIGRDDVSVFIYFPVNITGQTTKSYVDEFTIREDIRLRKVYDFVNKIITNDVQDAHYYMHGQSIEGGTITAIVYWNIGASDPDNLVWVEDIKSILKFRAVENQTYKFWFGVDNRQPALGCIRVIEECPYQACPDDPLKEVIKPTPKDPGWEVDDWPYGAMLPESVRPDTMNYWVVPEYCSCGGCTCICPPLPEPCPNKCPEFKLIWVQAFLRDEGGKTDCELSIPVQCLCCCP